MGFSGRQIACYKRVCDSLIYLRCARLRSDDDKPAGIGLVNLRLEHFKFRGDINELLLLKFRVSDCVRFR